MQNRYVGDVGDFGKHGLLRFLSGRTADDDLDRLKLGVVWYMHHDERHQGADKTAINRDGKHTEYLVRTPKDDRQEYRDCDPDLWEKLRDLLLRDARCVHCAREMGILPEGTTFYDAQLHYLKGSTKTAKEARKATREHWFQGALIATKGLDIVCVDPDNGIAPDKDMFLKDGPKHVYMSDLKALWERGQSLVIYHQLDHTAPTPEQVRLKANTLQDGLKEAEPIPLLFHRGSARVFFVVPQPERKEIIKARISRMLDGAWGRHFEWVC